MMELTSLKMMLMLLATPGMMAPAATATKPAIKAYSMRSWPRRSFQIRELSTTRTICNTVGSFYTAILISLYEINIISSKYEWYVRTRMLSEINPIFSEITLVLDKATAE